MSSLLGYYKLLYGPQILLQMNIAYGFPSIPLLLVSSLMDRWLDRRFGEACSFHPIMLKYHLLCCQLAHELY